MTEHEINAKLDVLTARIDQIYTSTEKTRKYFLWTLIISVLLFVVPLLGILFAAPSFLSTYSGQLQGLEQGY